VEEALLYQGKEDFVKSFHEEVEVLMVCKGSNKASRFLEAVVFAEGGRKGVIWLPAGCGGWGWHQFVSELWHLPALIVAKDWPLVSGVISGDGGILSTRSYAAVFFMALGGLKLLSMNHLGLVLVVGCSELVNGGEEARSPVNCFEFEYGAPTQKEKVGSLLVEDFLREATL
jgi:hypothetical protein